MVFSTINANNCSVYSICMAFELINRHKFKSGIYHTFLISCFQLVTTNEKLEMQIRNLNKSQNNSPCVQRSNVLSLDEKEGCQNDVKKVQDTSITKTTSSNQSGKILSSSFEK